MYEFLLVIVFALNIFVPSFIAIRDRTNADWRTQYDSAPDAERRVDAQRQTKTRCGVSAALNQN